MFLNFLCLTSNREKAEIVSPTAGYVGNTKISESPYTYNYVARARLGQDFAIIVNY